MKINQKSTAITFLLLLNFLFMEKNLSQEKVAFPPFQAERIPEIDIQHIIINLQFDWKKKQAFGSTTLFLSTLKSTSKIHLDAGMLTINAIQLSNGKKLQFQYDGSAKNNALEILLDKTYKANQKISIIIDYHTNWVNEIDPNALGGNNGKGIRFTEPTSNDPLKNREIWSFADVESNRYWFPSYDAPNDLRTTEFIATVDSNLVVISNGKLESKKSNANGTTTFHYKTTTPYANHLTAFAVGKWTNVKQQFNKTEINNYGYSEQKDWVKATVERLPDMMNFVTNFIGVAYPYTNYSQVFVQDIGSFSNNNSFSTITENMVDDFQTHADYFYLWDLTEAEALSQQWFGSSISPKSYSDFWLTKSLAHYCNGLYNEHKNGRDEFLTYQLSFDQSTYLFDWNSGYQRPIVTSHFEDANSFTNDNYTTYRGTLVLHMLRQQIGDELFEKTIQSFAKTHRNSLVSTEDFITTVEKTTGKSMRWFFNQWLFQMNHPIFEVSKIFDSNKKQLVLTVKQTQKVNPKNKYPQTEFFQGKIAIEMDNRIETIELEAKPINTFIFACNEEPKLIYFDFESAWIKELVFEKSSEELQYQLVHSKDILAQLSALNELVTLSKKETTSNDDKLKIKQAVESIISGNSYWRLRNLAISQLLNLIGNETLNKTDENILLQCIDKEQSWLKANAIRVLGTTKKQEYVDLYLQLFNDPSQRVVASAAAALGKTKSPRAYDALLLLMEKTSMKSQSRIAALNGLRELGDERGFEIALKALSDLNLPRWRLATSGWDYRVFAAQLIASLNKSEVVLPLILERFKNSLNENDIDGVFNNIVLINALAHPKGQEAYDLLKEKYANNTTIMSAITTFEEQFKNVIKP
ncbi:MAG: HEAT repeat domain-containing protein [Flavobacterium sp.]|nr:HEAT repeat domain-containing protein [Flavobacterium sp.]